MTVETLLNTWAYHWLTTKYRGLRIEIRRTKPKPGEAPAIMLTRKQAVEQFGDHMVWLAFRDEGTFDDPMHGGECFAVCIDKNGWEGQ